MKAWKVYDTYYWNPYAIIVFAETRNKAIVNALGEPEFEGAEYIDLRAVRYPDADEMYQENKDRLDICRPEDELFLVKHGWQCTEEMYDPHYCKACAGKDICDYRKERLKEENE